MSEVVPDVSTYTEAELKNLPVALPEFTKIVDGQVLPIMSRGEAELIIRRYPTMFPEVHAAYGGKPLPTAPAGVDPALYARFPKMFAPPLT